MKDDRGKGIGGQMSGLSQQTTLLEPLICELSVLGHQGIQMWYVLAYTAPPSYSRYKSIKDSERSS